MWSPHGLFFTHSGGSVRLTLMIGKMKNNQHAQLRGSGAGHEWLVSQNAVESFFNNLFVFNDSINEWVDTSESLIEGLQHAMREGALSSNQCARMLNMVLSVRGLMMESEYVFFHESHCPCVHAEKG